VESGGVDGITSVNGNIGIGGSPTERLSIKNSTGNGTLDIKTGTVTADSVRIQSGGSATNYLEYRGYLGHVWFVDTTERMRIDSSGKISISASDQGIQIGPDVAAYTIKRDSNGLLNFRATQSGFNGYVFDTADGERLRIDSSGNGTFFGSTFTFAAPNNGMVIHKNSVPSATNTPSRIAFDGTSTGSITCLEFKFSGTQVGSIVRGTGGTSYNTSSDYRLKENITEITDGINRVKQLNPSRFNFISDPDRIVDGFIAHEAQEVVPESVTGTKDSVDDEGNPEYQGIDQSKLVPLLTAALQEAIAKIEMLESRIAALEAKLA